MITITIENQGFDIRLSDAIKLWKDLGIALKQYECPCCSNPGICRRIPSRYLSWMQVTKPITMPFCPLIACDLCISSAANRKRKNEEREYLELNGYIQSNYISSIYDNARDKIIGYVYICQHNQELIKIGTSVNVLQRMSQQGYRREQFIFAIKTIAPYQLETFFHNKFRKKRTYDDKSTEVFHLTIEDIRFVLNIKTFRDFKIEIITCVDDFD